MSESPSLREYFYVDNDRVDSLWAQTGGDPIDGNPASRRYGDALFSRFEARAEELGLVADVSDLAADGESWTSGELHDEVMGGGLIRITAPIRMMDSDSVQLVLQRLFRLFEATTAAERPISSRATRRAGGGGGGVGGPAASDSPFSFVTDLYGSLLPGGLWLRSMPVADLPEHCFVGALSTSNPYIAEERASLLGRYGAATSEWTMVASVARLATERSTTEFPEVDPFDESGNFSPAAIEDLHDQMLDMVEGFGLVGAPVWPSVSVTPLAIYRPLRPVHGDGADSGSSGSGARPGAGAGAAAAKGAAKKAAPAGKTLKF